MLLLLFLFSLASYFMPCKLTMNVNKQVECVYEEFKIQMTPINTWIILTAFSLAVVTCVEYQYCGNHLCYPVKIKKLIVQIDADGTDDHVYLDICSDSDNEGMSCCTTGTLESMLANDWSSGDREEWGANFLGDCQEKEFRVSQGFQIKLSKDGDDSLAVNDITIQVGREECGSFLLWSLGCDIVERENFSCGRFELGNTGAGENDRIRSRQTNKCKIKVTLFAEDILLASD